MGHLGPGGIAVLATFLIIGIVCPVILIKFWSPKHGAYGRRGKREWDDDDQYDRRRRKRGGARTAAAAAAAAGRNKGRRERQYQMEDPYGGEGAGEMQSPYRPEGDWTSAPAPAQAPAQAATVGMAMGIGNPPYYPQSQGGQMYAGAYGLPPPGAGIGLPPGRGEEGRGYYTALGTAPGPGPGTAPSTPAPRYTPGGYRAPTSQPHTPSGLRCASLPHLSEEEEHAGGGGGGRAHPPLPAPYGPGSYGPPSGAGAAGGHQNPLSPTSPPGQSNSNWLRKSSNALGRPLELVIGPARSQPRNRNDERANGMGMGMAREGGGGGQTQHLGEWKKGVPLRPLEAVAAGPERLGTDFIPPHTAVTPQPQPQQQRTPAHQPATNEPGSLFVLPVLPASSQPLFDPARQGQTLAPGPGASST